jgi:hypothetical protein
MSKPAAKPVAQKPDPKSAPRWSDYDPYFPTRKASAGAQGATVAGALNRSNSLHFPRLSRAGRG